MPVFSSRLSQLLPPCRRFFLLALASSLFASFPTRAEPVVERLGRGVIATAQADGKVFLSWRLLASDPDRVAFNVYRATGDAKNPVQNSRPDTAPGSVKLNPAPLTGGTWFLDGNPVFPQASSYFVRPVVNGIEGPPSEPFVFPAGAPPPPYRSVPIQTPPGYTPGDASVGDLDGDGDYEIILKQEERPQDNSHAGKTGDTLLQAYQLDGTLLWTIHLGKNIREGAHYTQFMVYDFDGDGRAELACKTADGTVDGTGKVIGDANADYRSDAGYVLRGPEFFTIFDGRTGAALSTVPYVPARHPTHPLNPTSDELKKVWGDGYGNRMDRFLAGVAYLDGKHPSIIMCRGYYTRTVIVAWDWRDGKLTRRWTFDSDSSTANRPYGGQGYHALSIADVDGDGKDEILYGSMALDDNGKGLYSTGWGHGDAIHVSDLVPDNPGLEVFGIQERFDKQGMHMSDARTGRPIFTIPSVQAATEGGDKGEGPGRGLSDNIDPRYPGAESWAVGAGMNGVFDAHGKRLFDKPRDLPTNFAVWWDGDLLRELLDRNMITKWNWKPGTVDRLLTAQDCVANNGTKATPTLSADLYGDWREEVVWATRDKKELRIYTSTIPTKYRLVTLMQDPQYRVSVAWQNVGYNQPPHPGFALDDARPLPPRRKVSFPDSKAGL